MKRTFASAVAFSVCLWVGSWSSVNADELSGSDVDGSTEVVVADEDGGRGTGSEAEAQEPARNPKRGIEEVQVTGRRRTETIQQAPVTITAFTATDLEDKGIQELQDVTRYVPNLQFDQAAGDQNGARVYLRGIGNGDPIETDEGGVGVTVDDVFLPRAQGVLLSLSDIERIEVLSGPQATLYGKNTVGGLVRVISRKPSFERSSRAEVTVGNYDRFDTEFMYNTPLIEDLLAVRINLSSSYNDGYVKNRGPGRDRSQQTRSIRGQAMFLLEPNEYTEIFLKAYSTDSANTGYSAKCKLLAGFGGPDADPSVNGALFGPNGVIGSFNDECVRDQERDADEITSDGPQRAGLRTTGSSLQLTVNPSPGLTFKSISAWNRNTTDNAFDADTTALPLAQDTARDSSKSTQDSISQEFNLSGLALDGRLSWVTGVYGLVEKNQTNSRDTNAPSTAGNPVPLNFGGVLFNGDIASNLVLGPVFDNIPFAPQPIALQNGAAPDCIPETELVIPIPARNPATGAPILNPFTGAPISLFQNDIVSCARLFQGIRSSGFRKSNVTSYAAYAQLDFDVTPELKVSFGTRYTHERKRVAREVMVDPADFGLIRSPVTIARGNFLNRFERSTRFGRFSPSASVSYQPTEDLNFYATWGRGFKSGGFNGRGVGDNTEILDYKEEIVTNYEFGIKSRWFDNRLTANASFFHQIYENIQLPDVQLVGQRIVVVTDNVGKARLNGFELQLTALVTPQLTISTNLGILSGRYEKLNPRSSTFAIVGPNDRLVGSPNYTGSISASYLLPVGSWGDLRSTFTWSHEGRKPSDPGNTEEIFSDKRGLLSGRISLELPDGRTRIALFGSNLLDREYVANGVNAIAFALRYFGPPRQVGLQVTRDF